MDDQRMIGGAALRSIGVENRFFVVGIGRKPVDGFGRHGDEAARIEDANGFCDCLLINCWDGHCASS